MNKIGARFHKKFHKKLNKCTRFWNWHSMQWLQIIGGLESVFQGKIDSINADSGINIPYNWLHYRVSGINIPCNCYLIRVLISFPCNSNALPKLWKKHYSYSLTFFDQYVSFISKSRRMTIPKLWEKHYMQINKSCNWILSVTIIK